MQSLELLKLLPVWVNPGHQVSSARILLQGHHLRAMGVVEDGKLLGLVSRERLAAAPDDESVRVAMERPGIILDACISVRRAAQIFVDADVDIAPVMKGGRFLGVLTSNMLLRELGRSWDPLTSLSYSDRLREWGMDVLRSGGEITILFLDLDDFGSFNKRFGHIVGDEVLRRVAGALNDAVDLERDILVRYGGDEFAIGTTRYGEELQELLSTVRTKMGALTLEETGEPIGFCLGWHGGRRTHEREEAHVAATLDDLINLASRKCLRQKRAHPRGIRLEPLPERSAEDLAWRVEGEKGLLLSTLNP